MLQSDQYRVWLLIVKLLVDVLLALFAVTHW